jgi:hypothetical protein
MAWGDKTWIKPDPDFAEHDYGFTWYGVDVVRTSEHKGHKILDITTPKGKQITVRITPSGLIRVSGDFKEEK